MKIYYTLLILFIAAFISCGKDKFTTEPQVKINSIKPSTVTLGNIITVKGEYTDQEGDLDSALIVYKWYNGATAVRHDTARFTFASLNLPSDIKEAQINLDFQYATSNPNGYMTLPGGNRDTTAALGLILIDKAGNRSNYAESDQIRLIKP
ncbi:MAG TPA: hypothetical protein PKC72_08460 [Chitinophagaceae bacterium]|nr:hypothetical protein [Chitinophagaceae bacterium]